MNRLVFPLTFLMATFFVVSTPGSFAQNPELDQMISALQAKYQKLRSLAADFTQIYTASGERTRRESGHLLLKKPGKMRWDYTTPESKLFVSNGRVLTEYVPADKFATRVPVKESHDMRAPFMFLLGRGSLRRDFGRIEFDRESPARAGNIVLRLVPKRTQEFKHLLLEIEPGSLQIARLSFVDSDNARSDFLFSNIRENVPTSEEQFVFKAPPGVEVRSND
jgi:outer membrane lipoprotein carrier protein